VLFRSDDTTLKELINQGKVNPQDQSLKVLNAIHAEWKDKPFKTFARLIWKKLLNITIKQLINALVESLSHL
jgi:hypothetical protein